MVLKELRSRVDPILMTRLKVVEWKRYGNHRLYVKTEAGQDVGWVDLNSSKFGLDREDLRPEFELALREHAVGYLIEGDEVLVSGDRRVCRPNVAGDPMGMHQWDDRSTPLPQLKQLEQPWTDLALNTPGQGIRTLAKAHRDAAPFRTGVARLFNVHTDERAYRVGADGEEATAKQLARLPREWYALHSVPVGSHGSDIDHVVIGPGGVFTINTKHHPRSTVWVAGETFLINGRRQPYVRDSRFEVKRAMRLLANATGSPVPVVGVIAVVGAHEGFKVKEQPKGGTVHVVSRKELAGWLMQRPVRFNTVEIGCIYDHARRSTTWE
jgi:hypothetical protein